MKLIDLQCKCGATLKVNAELNRCMCQYCGNEMLIDHEVQQHNVNFQNGYNFGYEQEMGRQQAIRDAQARAQWEQQQRLIQSQKLYEKKKKEEEAKKVRIALCGFIAFLFISASCAMRDNNNSDKASSSKSSSEYVESTQPQEDEYWDEQREKAEKAGKDAAEFFNGLYD